MAIDVFDISDYAQVAIRKDTGIFPGQYSLDVFISSNPWPSKNTIDMSASVAMDWERQVQMAKWILENDAWIRNKKEEEVSE